MGLVLPPRRPDPPRRDTGDGRDPGGGAQPADELAQTGAGAEPADEPAQTGEGGQAGAGVQPVGDGDGAAAAVAGLLEVEGFRLAFEDSAIGMSIEDLDGRFIQVNPALCSMLGYDRDELIGQPYSRVCHAEDLEDDSHLTGLRSGWITRYVREMRYIRSDGATIWVRVHIGVIRGDDGRPCFYTAQIEDISERHRAEQRFRCAFDDAAVGMAVAELRRPGSDTLLQVNDATATLLGRKPGEVIGRILSRFVHPDDVATTDALFNRLREGEVRQAEVVTRIVRPDRTMVWVNVSASVADDLEGQPAYLVLHLQDITARETAEARLIEQAEHDALTGLPNRTVLAERVGAALAKGEAALLFVDLDRFKLVNDSLGHATGDELLVAVGRRLAGSVPSDGLVARIGGDEFVVLMPSTSQAQDYADSIQEVLTEPFRVGGRLLRVTASVGIAAAGPGDHADDLLRAADLAMYRAKTLGKARSAVYDSSMRADAEVRLAVEQDLHRAVETPGELLVWFQPAISLVTGRIVLAEALLRWQHPERGLLHPSEFLPVAEETGLIGSIGWLVLDQTLREMRSWRDAGLGVVGSVNLSGNQLDEPGFAEHVGSALRRHALLPADLCLEVTERVLVDPGSRAAATVESLRRYGVAIAIDDFGRGHSSLAYLRDHPVDIVKIDGVFVTALETNPRDAAIVGGMVQLAHALGMTCVAEGVETEAQLSRLTDLGCDQVQGYLLARPLPAADFTATLIEGGAARAIRPRHPASRQRTM